MTGKGVVRNRKRTRPREGAADGRAGTGSEELDTDQLYDLLANRRRRFVIHYLKGTEGATEIGKLTEQIAAWELGCGTDELGRTERKRVYTALQQSHLPFMQDSGLIEYDKERKRIEPAARLFDVTVYPNRRPTTTPLWNAVTIGLCVLFAAVVSSLWLDVWPVTELSPLAWATIFLATFAISILGSWWMARTDENGTLEAPPELDG